MHPIQKPDITTATDVPVDTPSCVLRGAALYLERHGWTQGMYFDFTVDANFQPACVMGAIRIAVFGGTSHPTDSVSADHSDAILIRATQRYLASHVDPDFGRPVDDNIDDRIDDDGRDYGPTDRIGDWNDATERTAAEVIDTLRAAADEWDRIHGHSASAAGQTGHPAEHIGGTR